MNKFQQIFNNEKGQGLMEYIIISALVGIFCLLAMGNYGKALKNQINYMKKQINTLPK